MNEFEIALYFMEPQQLAHQMYREYLMNRIRAKPNPHRRQLTSYDVDATLAYDMPDAQTKYLATRYGMCLDIRAHEIHELIAGSQTSLEMGMLKRSTL